MSQINYITSNASDDLVKLRVFIKAGDFTGKAAIKYYLGSEEIGCSQCFSVPMGDLAKAAQDHPDFKWTMINGVTPGETTTFKRIKKETSILVEKTEQEVNANDIPTLKVK